MSAPFVAFQRLWDTDPYAIKRTRALLWLGVRYLCYKPINRKTQIA